MSYIQLVGFGDGGWGRLLLLGAAVTFSIAIAGFLLGAVIGGFIAWMKLSKLKALKFAGEAYTTILRGVPDLLVIYLLYFGGNSLLSSIAGAFEADGFVGMPTYLTGVVAIGIVSGAYQAEIYRGSYHAVHRGGIEAGQSVGMGSWLLFRRIIAPQVLHYAIPGLGNVWQLALKETALISVVGLVELLRQAQMGAGSTRRPFEFFITAGILYLAITAISSLMFRFLERGSNARMGSEL